MSEVLLKSVEDGVGTLVINRPDAGNSLTVELLEDLQATLGAWSADDSVRVVVIRGAGERAFCGGFDVRSIPTRARPENAQAFAGTNPVAAGLRAIKDFPYPVIAMINGYVMGAGFNLTMCCDLRIAADHARMGIPPAKLGLVYYPEGVKQVVMAIGLARAREVFFTGRAYGPEDVREMGLVHRMVPQAELERVTRELAREIAQNAPLSLKGIKRILGMLEAGIEMSDSDWAEAERLSAASFLSEDAREGQLAFLQKRKPVFKGR